MELASGRPLMPGTQFFACARYMTLLGDRGIKISANNLNHTLNKSSLEHIPLHLVSSSASMVPSTAVQVILTISTWLVLCMSRRNRAYMQWAWSMDVAIMANKKALFVMLMGRTERIVAHLSQFFADFDVVIMLITR